MSLIDIKYSNILNIVTTNTYLMISKLFTTIDQRNFILDPLSCVIRLGILYFKPKGTKISIYQNKISYHEPCILQGSIRWTNGDNRNDLHNLHNPILKALEWYDINDPTIKTIFNLACKGLEKLKYSYDKNSIICHSIDRYIGLLAKNEKISKDDIDIDNNLHISLKELWNPTQINIIYNLLTEVSNLNNKSNINNETKISLIKAIDNILDTKEKNVSEIIKKNTTIL